MRFRGNGRKVAQQACADRETVISFHSVLAPLAPGQGGRHTHTASVLSRTASSTSENATTTKGKALPSRP